MKLMFKGNLWLHQIVLFGVLGVLVLWKVITGSFVFDINLLWWLLGAMLGFLFVFLDRVVYNLFSKADTTAKVNVQDVSGKGIFVEGVKLLLAEGFDQKEMVMRSFLFLVVWIVLGFFAMTSVMNFFARGFILGMGTHLMFDFVYDFSENKEKFDKWFWQIKRTLEPDEKFWVVIISGVLFVLLAFNL